MSYFKNWFSVLSLCLVLVGPSVVFAGDFSLVGIGVSDKPALNPAGNSTVTSKTGLGGGALFGTSLERGVHLESGILYITRKYSIDSGPYLQHAVEVPLLFRVWVLPMFSMAAGGYAAFGTDSQANTNAGLKDQDFGALFSASLRFPIVMGMNLLLDGRYGMGLTNVLSDSSSGATRKNRDVQGIVGFQFSMMGRGR